MTPSGPSKPGAPSGDIFILSSLLRPGSMVKCLAERRSHLRRSVCSKMVLVKTVCSKTEPETSAPVKSASERSQWLNRIPGNFICTKLLNCIWQPLKTGAAKNGWQSLHTTPISLQPSNNTSLKAVFRTGTLLRLQSVKRQSMKTRPERSAPVKSKLTNLHSSNSVSLILSSANAPSLNSWFVMAQK